MGLRYENYSLFGQHERLHSHEQCVRRYAAIAEACKVCCSSWKVARCILGGDRSYRGDPRLVSWW
jgi:hypothetical protein